VKLLRISAAVKDIIQDAVYKFNQKFAAWVASTLSTRELLNVC
jgi:hypothetical protein